ncbi:MAG: hypothetical protein AMXMBFR49_24870 [Chlorobiota bacterium]
MPGKALIILLAGVIGLSAVTFLNILKAGDKLTESSVSTYNAAQVKNIAEAGAQMAVRKMIVEPSWRTGFSNLSLMGGRVNVRLVDTTFTGQAVTKVQSIARVSIGSSLEKSYTAICYFQRATISTVRPPAIKGAITANTAITTLGNLTVDGQNHDTSGGFLAAGGTLGIWTTQTLSRSGNSKIGGTNTLGTNYSPSKTPPAGIIATSQVFPGGFPLSPDSLMGGPLNGYPEGTLKAIAMSGAGGSQYTTNPGTLTYPLRGVTYVELPDGGLWNSATITGSGILVVHNTTVNAGIKNLNTGPFKGILLADDIVHVHCDIIGAVIAISSSPSSGNCIGNGSGRILYSGDAVTNATNLANLRSSNSVSVNQQILYWFE